MKSLTVLTHACLGLLFLLSDPSHAHADITVRCSVKFIHKPDGTAPAAGNIGTAAGFGAEVTRGNQVLATTGRGYRVQVVEYLDIQPPVPMGQASDYWFNLDARDNRATFEAAALANTAVWRWNGATINIYVNNSGSGQCSLVGNGLSISLGNDIGLGTVLHELGHYFDLRHTHSAADNNGTVGDWGDGDGLDETLPDDPDASRGDIDARYPSESQQKRDDLFFNVMSYHNEDRLLTGQMDVWTLNANRDRAGFCSGKTWFVAVGGSDGASGDNAGSPLATVSRGLMRVGTADDIVLLRSGSYGAPTSGIIATPCTLRATRGPVTVHYP